VRVAKILKILKIQIQ